MSGGSGAGSVLRWVALQAVLLWALALAAALAGVLPGLALRAGPLALVAGAAVGAWLLTRPADALPGPAWEGRREQEGHARRKRPSWLRQVGPAHVVLLAAMVLAVALHWAAADRAGVPIGYDYGFYKEAFAAYEGGVPDDAPRWLDLQFEPGLPALHAVLHGVSGLSATQHATGFWAVLACALVPAAFVAVRPLAGDRAAALAALLAAVSFTQAEAYAYLYEKNVLALTLLVVAVFLLGRRSWVAAGVVLAGVALLQRPTALLALLALPLAALPRVRLDWQGWAKSAGVGLAIALPVWLAWPETFFGVGSTVALQSAAVVSAGATGSEGTFFSGKEYLAAAAAYLPVAVAGLVAAVRRPAWRLPAIAFAVAGAYVALQLPLHLRFLLMADAFAIVLAGLGLAAVLAALGHGARRWTWPIVAALVVAAAAPTLVETAEPSTPHVFVTPDQFEAIQRLDALPEGSLLIADNLRAPYVLAETRHRTVGPGLFDDPHDRSDWDAFWAGLDEAGTSAFLADYGPAAAVYVVQVEEPGPEWGSATVHEPAFERVQSGQGLHVWRWTGGPPEAASA